MGTCLVAFARSLSIALSVFHMEPEACRAGLLIAIHEEWSDVDLESDWSYVITALKGSSVDLFEVGRIVDNCREYMNMFNSINVYREANCVANRLAHIGSYFWIDNFWLDETLSIIKDVLYEDFYSCTRGSSSTSFSRAFPAIINKRLEDK